MAADTNRPNNGLLESAAPTRRRFLGVAGLVAASGSSLLGETTTAPSIELAVKEQLAPMVTASPEAEPSGPRPTCLVATGDGNHAVTCNDKGHVLLWDLTKPNTDPTEFKKPRIAKASFVTVSKPTDGSDPVVLVSSFDGVVSIYSLGLLTRTAVFDDHLASNGPLVQVWAVAVTSNGKKAVSSTNAGEIRVWDVAGTQTLAVAANTDDPVAALTLLPNPPANAIQFLAGYGDGRICQWRCDFDAVTGQGKLTEEGEIFQGNAMPVNSIVLYTSGPTTYVLSGGMDANLRVWQLTDQTPPTIPPVKVSPRTTYTFHSHFVWRVAISPDGKTLASVSEDKTLSIFDVNGNPRTFTKPAHSRGIMGVDFMDNSHVVITTDNAWQKKMDATEIEIVPFT